MIYEFIIMLIGWLYPAFATYNSLNGNLRSQVSWMKYWIVFGVFNAFHFFTGCLEPWVPFLSGFKLFILCWLLPSLGSGSQFIHDDILDPLLKSNKEAINRTVESVSSVSSALLRELVKMIYHLLVDVVEQCWLMTRNANDIHVTPRLQAAINEQAAIQLEDVKTVEPQPPSPSSPPPPPLPLPKLDASQPTNGAFRAAALSSSMIDDQLALRILLAEAVSAERMQLCQQLSSSEHLAPIHSHVRVVPPITTKPTPKPQRPPKPKRGKRKHLEATAARFQLEMDLDADRAYREYCDADDEEKH
ncbi:receptor expression-enhancing protein 1 [Drosophila novamexicana]|uniref:receptor expression-enhancing protein 1 n=1 Tax=Drosophila novamexicana TaxID=47314 RepID=UPI0011E600CF|nr:receptor expression-enhancing protein 1 [Drosophila novamexicana]